MRSDNLMTVADGTIRNTEGWGAVREGLTLPVNRQIEPKVALDLVPTDARCSLMGPASVAYAGSGSTPQYRPQLCLQ